MYFNLILVFKLIKTLQYAKKRKKRPLGSMKLDSPNLKSNFGGDIRFSGKSDIVSFAKF